MVLPSERSIAPIFFVTIEVLLFPTLKYADGILIGKSLKKIVKIYTLFFIFEIKNKNFMKKNNMIRKEISKRNNS